jgi:hypothetical protein
MPIVVMKEVIALHIFKQANHPADRARNRCDEFAPRRWFRFEELNSPNLPMLLDRGKDWINIFGVQAAGVVAVSAATRIAARRVVVFD